MKILVSLGLCLGLSLAAGEAFAAPQKAPDKTPPAAAGAAPGKYAVGKATVYSLQDVARDMDTSIFSGAPAETISKLAPTGKAPSSVYVFLIKNGGRTILVDTGFGKRENPASQLLAKMAAVGVKPEAVTHLLLTHLHGDHVGGLAWNGKAAFPNAEVLVSAPEKEYWLDPATLEKNPGRKGNIDLIRTNFALYGSKVKTFTLGDTVLPGILSVASAGHTPGHAAFLLESGKDRMLFWGDIVHAAALQFPDPKICAQYDMDAPGAVAARLAMMDLAARGNMPVAGAHLPAPGVGRVKTGKEKDTFVYTPGM